jgi:alkylation response protein AidB-like acyl-CoA dehydrogenase
MAARLAFDGVQVDRRCRDWRCRWRLGCPCKDAQRRTHRAAAEMVGVGTGAMDLTFDYLKQRKQFGKLIGEFQALQHRAAHLYGEMEMARSIVLKAQNLFDDGDPTS